MKNHVKFTNEGYSMRGGSRVCARIYLPSFCKALLAVIAFLIAFTVFNTCCLRVSATGYEAEVRDIQEVTIDWGPSDSKASDENIGVFEWTGEQIKPFVSIKDARGFSLIEGYEYSVSYGTNVEPGKGTITVMGLECNNSGYDKWKGSKTFEFEIIKAENPLKDTGYADGENSINGVYHDNFVFCKNLKNEISETIDQSFTDEEYGEIGKKELIDAVKKCNLNFKSGDKRIFKLNKSKNSVTVTGVGIAYLTFTIPETAHFESFDGKIGIISYPPRTNDIKYSIRLEKGNRFRFGVTSGKPVNKCKTDFKCKVVIATSKKFTKSSIVKSYTLTKKQFVKQKIKTIKSKKLKKGKSFYIKTYTYKKLSDGRIMYGSTNIDGYKVAKNGKIKDIKINGEEFISKDPYIK